MLNTVGEDSGAPRAWPISLAVLAVWVLVTLGGELLYTRGAPMSIEVLIRGSLAYGVTAAALGTIAVITWFKWWPEVGLARPRELRQLWLPVVVVAVFLAITLLGWSHPQRGVAFVVLNTLLVAVSEELMFRGVLLHGARARYAVVPAVLVAAVIFGSIHVFNALITGNVGSGLVQAAVASLFGVWSGAMRVRTGSILPSMAMHWLWDCLLILGGAGVAVAALLFTPALLIWGLLLLRGHGAPTTPPAAGATPAGYDSSHA